MTNGNQPENFINGQGRAAYANIPYGRSTVGKAGCEAIACYNAMMLLGRPVPFEEVKAFFERLFKRGLGWGFGGILGATPIEIHMFLKSRGVSFTRICSVRAFKKKDAAGELPPGILIVSYWNKPIFKYGFHTVAIDCRGKKLLVYNRYSNSSSPDPITDLSQLMEGDRRFISSFYIKL